MHIYDARGNLINLHLVREFEVAQDATGDRWTLYAVFDATHRAPVRHYQTAEEARAGVERLHDQLNHGPATRVGLD